MAVRTAAGSALATQLCESRANHLVLFTAGLQAKCHVETIICVLQGSLQWITIINRGRARAEALSAVQQSVSTNNAVLLQDTTTIQHVLQEAGVLIASTNIMVPLFDGSFLPKGCHVNWFGSHPPRC